MTIAYDQRIADERRFLAAFFLYPREVDLEARHFLAPQHGLLFNCIEEAYRQLPWEPSDGHWYDEVALAVVLEIVRRRAQEVMDFLGRPRWPNPHELTRWAEEYFVHTLMAQPVTKYSLADLAELVRACPRCGR